MLRSDAVDILRPSLDAFGISGIRRIAALAETYYVAVAPRRGTGELASLAALHLAASLPNFFIQEIPPDLPWRVQDGYVNLPEGAGLGRMA